MADIKNKNELKRRIDLFLDEEIDYSINEAFCKETMRMMKEFIGHACHRVDCADSKAKSSQDKLKQYQKLEKNGLLLRLPCKVGTPVYMIATDCGGDTLDCRRGECEGCGYLYSFVEENAFDTYMVDDIGKSVFLTKEEVEAKMAEEKKE